MNKRNYIAVILLTAVLAVLAVISVRRFKMSPAGGVLRRGRVGDNRTPKCDCLCCGKSSFTDAIDGSRGNGERGHH
jgi:hypothetical protein